MPRVTIFSHNCGLCSWYFSVFPNLSLKTYLQGQLLFRWALGHQWRHLCPCLRPKWNWESINRLGQLFRCEQRYCTQSRAIIRGQNLAGGNRGFVEHVIIPQFFTAILEREPSERCNFLFLQYVGQGYMGMKERFNSKSWRTWENIWVVQPSTFNLGIFLKPSQPVVWVQSFLVFL